MFRYQYPIIMLVEVNLHCEFSRGPRAIQKMYKGPRYKKS